MKRSISVLLFFFLTVCVFGQDSVAIKYSRLLDTDRLASHIARIASDSLQGRLIGEEGHQKAAGYIKDQFIKSGLSDPAHEYMQNFNIVKSYWSDIYMKSGDRVFRNLQDGIIYLGSKNIPDENEFTMNFMGNAIDKDLVGSQSMIYFNTPYWISLRREYSENLSASFSLIIDNTHTNNFDSIACLMNKPFETMAYFFPESGKVPDPDCASAFIISERVASTIFNMKVGKIRRIGSYSGKGIKKVRGFEPVNLTVKAERRYDTLEISNVLGFIEGGEKKEEVIVLSAHYDHLGVNENKIFPGADDNASGVAALLEIARAFREAKMDGYGPKRSLLFIAFTGEEKGLFGSDYYVRNPVVPLDNTVANLNIDMVGRVDEANADDPDYIYLIGSDKISAGLHEISEETNEKYSGLRLDYTYNSDDDPNRYYYRSDHYHFARHNIPVIFYFNGVHEDYHQPTDTIDKIDFSALKKRAGLIFFTAWELANADKRPAATNGTVEAGQ